MDGTNSHINNKPFNSSRGIAMLFLTINNSDLLLTIETSTYPDFKGKVNK